MTQAAEDPDGSTTLTLIDVLGECPEQLRKMVNDLVEPLLEERDRLKAEIKTLTSKNLGLERELAEYKDELFKLHANMEILVQAADRLGPL